MTVKVKLGRRSIEASDEKTFQEWMAFVAKRIRALDMPSVDVSALPARDDQADRIEGGGYGNAEQIRETMERSWKEFCDLPMPGGPPTTFTVVVWDEWQTHVHPFSFSAASPDLLESELERARKMHAGAEIVEWGQSADAVKDIIARWHAENEKKS